MKTGIGGNDQFPTNTNYVAYIWQVRDLNNLFEELRLSGSIK